MIIVLFAQTIVFGQSEPILFKDISKESGISVPHISTAENRYILETISGGAAVFDCNEDGFLDVATVNGSSVDNFVKGGDLFVSLYRQVDISNSNTVKFEEITKIAGLNRKGWGMGVTAVDFDNDGHLDLFVTGFQRNAVYKGKGGCSFADVTEKSGLTGEGFQTGAAWADYDRDGDLDVFVSGYVFVDLDNLPVFGSSQTCSFRGIRVHCGPRGLKGERDHFYQNKGDGTFEEISSKIGVSDTNKYYALGVIWADYDNDGWQDFYVANDTTPNYLYRNNRDGTFSEVGFETGMSYSGSGGEQASMGVDWGDFDGDERLDFFTTNFDGEHNTLYRNLGRKGFLDVSAETRIGQPSKPFVGWGTGFFDFDNNGLLDVLVVNGHVYPQTELSKSKTQTGFKQRFLLHRNLGNGKFEDVTNASGLDDFPLFSSRGTAFGDLNNDGLVDAVVTNLGERPTVLLNTTKTSNRSVTIRLREAKNKGAIGSRVILSTEKRKLVLEVRAGASYLSQNDIRLQIGIPKGETIKETKIRWSDGSIEKVSGVVPDRIITIIQGKGISDSKRYTGKVSN